MSFPNADHEVVSKSLFTDNMKIVQRKSDLISLSQLLEHAYKKYKNNVALIFKDQKIKYKELYFRTALFTMHLRKMGIRSNDRVLVFIENSVYFYIAYFAVLQTGSTVAPLNVFLTEKELAYIIKDALPQAIITNNHLKPLVEKALKSLQMTKIDIVTEDDVDMITPVPNDIPEVVIPERDPEKLAVLLYTSGTTGKPKGVMLSSVNALSNAVQAMTAIDFGESARIFCVLPLFHSFAQNTCIWTAIALGCSVVIISKIDRRAILKGLIDHKPDIFLGVPALYGLLCLMKTAPLESVRFFVSGGDALPDKIRSGFALIYNRKICNGYGLTEASPLISFDTEDMLEATNTVGRPVANLEYRFKGSDGNDLPHGQIGRLWVKGPNIMMGYYNDLSKTEEVLQDEWLDTGDFACLSSAGKLVITGRAKDLIIHKGINIYPQEIENVLLSHPNVIRAAVIGKQEESSGEIPIAFVQLREAQNNIEKELQDICLRELAPYKVPRKIKAMIEDMPLTATKKVDKKQLRNQIQEEVS